MYTIIGGDQKEYGPISAEDVRQWIAEGRLNEKSQVKGEGDAEFRPLETFSEFAICFTPSSSMPKLPPSAFAVGIEPEKPLDYELDIAGCMSRGFELVKSNMGLLFVGALIYMLIEGAIGGLAQIPFVGALFSIANFIISGPLIGGVFYLFICSVRGEPAEIGDIFAGFRRAFGQLFLGTLVQGLFIGLCLLPFIIVFAIKILPLVGHLQSGSTPDRETVEAIKSVLLVSLPVLLVCAIPAIYLSVCWKFTLPLIVDKQLDFWTAMGASRKMVNKHWFHVFGLIVLISLLNLAGLCACCIGVLFTFPVGIAALMYAYETIFSEGPAA
ncbi:MAG TPA: DUF975 family protein [Verrucomicrobiae bacterium]|nr:DUF975 family protein [Verrucomicrobiae bacterium]